MQEIQKDTTVVRSTPVTGPTSIDTDTTNTHPTTIDEEDNLGANNNDLILSPPDYITKSEQTIQAEQDGRKSASSDSIHSRPVRANRGKFRNNDYAYLLDSSMKAHDSRFSPLLDLITTGDPVKILHSLQHESIDAAITI